MKRDRANRRTRLYIADPHCRYCGIRMIHPDEVGYVFDIKGNRYLREYPDNLCTMEHLHHKKNPERGKQRVVPTTTICCLKCNSNKGYEDNKKYTQV